MVKELIYKMLVENTGADRADSGGYPQYDEKGVYICSIQGYGRHWERNKHKKLEDFENEPEVFFNKDFGYHISLFHYLTKQLELDDFCNEFNSIENITFEGYSKISNEQLEFLKEKGYFISKDIENSYARDSNLSQNVLSAEVKEKDSLNEEGDYILVSIHNGCDDRGGHTNFKLFIPKSLDDYGCVTLLPEDIYGRVTRKNMIIPISNVYDGYHLRVDGEIEIIEDENQLKLFDISELDKINPPSLKEETILEFEENDIVELTLGF